MLACTLLGGHSWVRFCQQEFGDFRRLVGRYCSHLLPKQAGGTPKIFVDITLRMTSRLRVYKVLYLFIYWEGHSLQTITCNWTSYKCKGKDGTTIIKNLPNIHCWFHVDLFWQNLVWMKHQSTLPGWAQLPWTSPERSWRPLQNPGRPWSSASSGSPVYRERL